MPNHTIKNGSNDPRTNTLVFTHYNTVQYAYHFGSVLIF